MGRATQSNIARGWRLPAGTVSLPEVHGSIPIPVDAGFWRKLFAFAGPGYLVAVGYMDPGNWATDLAGGARYGYTLLSVIMLSNFMAILLQALAVRLGIASGRDLAQACRDSYSRPTTLALWLARPDLRAVASGFIPRAEILTNGDMLYIAIGILGATVMPHNLYLHSSIVQTRKYEETAEGKREAVRYAFVDSTIALTFALLINGAILIVAAATFHRTGN